MYTVQQDHSLVMEMDREGRNRCPQRTTDDVPMQKERGQSRVKRKFCCFYCALMIVTIIRLKPTALRVVIIKMSEKTKSKVGKRKLSGAENIARREQNLRSEDAKKMKKITDIYKRGKNFIILRIFFSIRISRLRFA